MSAMKPCRFCGSAETITVSAWPEWATRLVTADTPDGNVEKVKQEILGAWPSAHAAGEFVATRKLQVACEACHRGWMSRLDAQVRPLLLPLIGGAEITLTPGAQTALAAWIAKTIMIAEFASAQHVVTPKAERESLRQTRQAPASWNIWIAYNRDKNWSARYVRHSARLGPIGNPAKTVQNDTQSVTLGMRSVLVHAMMSTVAGMNFELPDNANSFQCLWPVSKTISWPPRGTLGPEEMDVFSQTISRDFGSPEVEHIVSAA